MVAGAAVGGMAGRLDGEKLKKTGGETLPMRQSGRLKPTSRAFKGIIIMNLNKVPRIQGFEEEAVHERITGWERKVQFVHNPQGPNQKQRVDVTDMVNSSPQLQSAIWWVPAVGP